MTRITIDSTEVHTKSGTSNRTGKPYSIREQGAWLHTGAKFPVACRLPLEEGQPPFEPGDYEVTSPLSVGRFEALQVNRNLGLRLIKSGTKAA